MSFRILLPNTMWITLCRPGNLRQAQCKSSQCTSIIDARTERASHIPTCSHTNGVHPPHETLLLNLTRLHPRPHLSPANLVPWQSTLGGSDIDGAQVQPLSPTAYVLVERTTPGSGHEVGERNRGPSLQNVGHCPQMEKHAVAARPASYAGPKSGDGGENGALRTSFWRAVESERPRARDQSGKAGSSFGRQLVRRQHRRPFGGRHPCCDPWCHIPHPRASRWYTRPPSCSGSGLSWILQQRPTSCTA